MVCDFFRLLSFVQAASSVPYIDGLLDVQCRGWILPRHEPDRRHPPHVYERRGMPDDYNL